MFTSAALQTTFYSFRSPVVPGVNGYYYVLQIQSLHDRGQLYFSKLTPGVLFLLAGIRWLVGEPVLAVKLGAIVLHVLLGVGIFLFILECTSSRWLGLVGSGLALFSGLSLYLVTEYISNLGAIALLVWSGWCALRFTKQHSYYWAVGALLLLVLAVLSHKSVWAIVILLGFFLAMQKVSLGLPVSRLRRAVAFLIVGTFWVAPGLLSTVKVVPLKVANEFSAIPQLPFDHYAFPEEIVLLVIAILVLLLLFQKLRPLRLAPQDSVLGMIAMFSIVVTLNPFLNSDRGWLGIAERVRVLSHVQVAILLPGAIYLLLQTGRSKFIAYVVAFVLPMVIVSATLPLPPGLQSNYLERRQRLIRSLDQVRSRLEPSAVIIAPHGDQFVVTATIGTRSQEQFPENSSERAYWLLNDVDDPSLGDSITLFANGYKRTMLIDDMLLKPRLKTMSSFERNQLLRSNPNLAEILKRGNYLRE